MVKSSTGYKVFTVFNYIFLTLLAIVCLLPILHVLFSSISDPTLLKSHTGIVLWPLGQATIMGYKLVLHNASVVRSYLNTIIYVTCATSLGVFLTLLAGYVLSRKQFMFKKPIMIFITFTMMFNGGLIPFFLVVKSLGWINNPLAVIVPACMSVFNIIIMRTAMAAIPDTLYESAILDGADHFTYFFKMVIPLAKATIAAVVLFTVVGSWNSWFGALMFLRTRDLYPLQLVIREVLIQNNTNALTSGGGVTSSAMSQNLYQYLVQYSTVIVTILPIICVYPFLQKYFVNGVMVGSLKG